VSVYTRTYTIVKTRLESIEDQFAHFLRYGEMPEDKAEKILLGIRERFIGAVGLYVTDAAGLRIAEVALHVSWERHGELVLVRPTVDLELPGWTETQSPEVKIAGRRFAELARELDRPVRYWVRMAASGGRGPGYRQACSRVGADPDRVVEEWKSQPTDRSDCLLDLPEVQVVIRRASDQ
jgi:hypothetical protein